MKLPVRLTINGDVFDIAVEPRRMLADAIRKDCGLTGTHIGCEHGVCGSCTVIVDGDPVRSCLMFAVQADGSEVVTIEGVGRNCPPPSMGEGREESPGRDAPVDDRLHPLQHAFIEHHGLQCGFCTPGFLMLAAAVLQRDPQISDPDLIDALSSNLCRCTGYQGIIDAVLAAARAMRASNRER